MLERLLQFFANFSAHKIEEEEQIEQALHEEHEDVLREELKQEHGRKQRKGCKRERPRPAKQE